MDVLIFLLKGISVYAKKVQQLGISKNKHGHFIAKALFVTVTNVNFNDDRIIEFIREAFQIRNSLRDAFLNAYEQQNGTPFSEELPLAATWSSDDPDDWHGIAPEAGVLAGKDETARSLRELLIIGLKGIAAYADHAMVLGYQDEKINGFFVDALASTTEDLPVSEMIDNVMQAGNMAVETMALLDKANTETYGHPEITKVNIGVRNRPAILISGHDLKDMQQLLEQSKDSGVDIYTHSEMLPANYYPALKTHDHFVGNYGGSWWRQKSEFEAFNGPVLMTTNCLIPPKTSYKDRVFTTGNVGFPGVKHIPNAENGGMKDFSEIIAMGKTCDPLQELEQGELVGGFAHHQVTALADKIVRAVKSGAIKRFIVMAGCDGRHKSRNYFTEVAQALRRDAVIPYCRLCKISLQ